MMYPLLFHITLFVSLNAFLDVAFQLLSLLTTSWGVHQKELPELGTHLPPHLSEDRIYDSCIMEYSL